MSSDLEKEYFRRVGEQNRLLTETPPGSLQEMFDRMAAMEQALGEFVSPGQFSDSSKGDLDSHLSYLKRLRRLDPSYRSIGTQNAS